MTGRCRDHPEREGVGICMKCRAVICTECTTRIDGINHCARCVAALGEASEKAVVDPKAVRAVALAALLCASVALVSLLTLWLGG